MCPSTRPTTPLLAFPLDRHIIRQLSAHRRQHAVRQIRHRRRRLVAGGDAGGASLDAAQPCRLEGKLYDQGVAAVAEGPAGVPGGGEKGEGRVEAGWVTVPAAAAR